MSTGLRGMPGGMERGGPSCGYHAVSTPIGDYIRYKIVSRPVKSTMFTGLQNMPEGMECGRPPRGNHAALPPRRLQRLRAGTQGAGPPLYILPRPIQDVQVTFT